MAQILTRTQLLRIVNVVWWVSTYLLAFTVGGLIAMMSPYLARFLLSLLGIAVTAVAVRWWGDWVLYRLRQRPVWAERATRASVHAERSSSRFIRHGCRVGVE